MNKPRACCGFSQTTVWALAIVGTFLIMGGLTWELRRRSAPPPIDQVRVAERTRFLAELRGANADALNQYAWIDVARGVVRLPIHIAMQRMMEEWKNPAQARSNLMARVERATAALPKAPEAPNPYE